MLRSRPLHPSVVSSCCQGETLSDPQLQAIVYELAMSLEACSCELILVAVRIVEIARIEVLVRREVTTK